MFKAILLDLDETLLINPMDQFMPAYFRALTQYVSGMIPPDRLMGALMSGVHAMEANDGTGPTNAEAFASVFYPSLKTDPEHLKSVFMKFYAEEFPKLRLLTRPHPAARPLIRWTNERKLQTAIATNPIFPAIAIEARLKWADVPSAEFVYDLVTAYENMHAIKPHPAYYREILTKLNRHPRECLMVGDDWGRDIVPAASLGIPVFWISAEERSSPGDGFSLYGQGTLFDLWDLIQTGTLGN